MKPLLSLVKSATHSFPQTPYKKLSFSIHAYNCIGLWLKIFCHFGIRCTKIQRIIGSHLIVSLNERARECAKNILPRMSNQIIGDVKGTSAIARQSNVHSYKRGTNAVCLITVLTASLSVHFEKLWCSSRAFALVFSIVFYSRIMATCSPSQERQFVLMESMNRRLDSFLASQKKLEEKTQRFSKKSYVKLRTERVLLKRRPKNEDVRPKTPWTKTKTLWTKTKTPWTKTKTPWTKMN